MSGLDNLENWMLTESDVIEDSRRKQKNILSFMEKFQVEAIINELNTFIKPTDFLKKNDLVDYICSWKLWSKEDKELEKMVDYMIYWSSEQGTTRVEKKWTRKLKYILDNYWKDIKEILIEISKKESENSPRKPTIKEDDRWIAEVFLEWMEWALSWLKDIFNYWVDKLTELRNSIVNLVPKSVKEWVKVNLFAPEKQKNTENINELYKKLKWREKPDFFPFYLAMQWYNKQKNNLRNKDYLTVIDYSKPVSQNRLYVINMKTLTVENCVPTWHGKNSGDTQKTTDFSNEKGSNKTSIGFFRTPSILKSNSKRTWKWLFLTWLEYSNNHANTNDPKTSRWIAIHPVWSFFWSRNGNWHKAWDSTSEGCITILTKDNPGEIMNKIKWDSLIYSYYPDMTYLNKSTMIA